MKTYSDLKRRVVFSVLIMMSIAAVPAMEAGAANNLILDLIIPILPEEQLSSWLLEGPPDGIAVGPDGSIYVNINNNHRLVGYTAGGVKFAEWTYEGVISGIAASPDNRVWVTINNGDQDEMVNINNNHRIVGYSPSGEVLAEWPLYCSDCQDPEANAIAAGPGGEIFVNINNNHRIVGYSPSGEVLAERPLYCSDCQDPEANAIAAGPGGEIFVNINNNHRIVGYSPSGEVLAEWPLYCSDCQDPEANAIAAGPGGEIFVNINNNHRIVGYTADGTNLGEWPYEGEATGFAVGPDGLFYLADRENSMIRVYGQ